MGNPVRFAVHQEVGLIEVEHPPGSALSRAVRQGLLDVLERAAGDSAVRVIILTCVGRTLVASPDIHDLGSQDEPPLLAEVIEAFEQCTKPTVALLVEDVFGGMLELALGCHYRVARVGCTFEMPEVQFGLIPGSGGTQRLPRLIGVSAALKLIVLGQAVGCEQAHEWGLIDRILEGNAVKGAIEFARQVRDENGPLRRLGDVRPVVAPTDESSFANCAKQVEHRMRGQVAPVAAMKAIREATTRSFAEGLALEQAHIAQLRQGSQFEALSHLQAAERRAVIAHSATDEMPVPVRRVGVLGAGKMGVAIATCFADLGLEVLLVDQTLEVCEQALASVERNLASAGLASWGVRGTMRAGGTQLRVSTSFADLARSDLVIEAVYEDRELKRALFARLARVCSEDAILATNTSTVNVNVLAEAAGRPTRVVGMHFFSPAHRMRLVEVVRGQTTDPAVVATICALARRMGKLPVTVGARTGFVGNRMFHPYRREAYCLLEEGASPQQVDQALRNFGFPMGPFAVVDLVGLDVNARIRRSLGSEESQWDRGAVAERLLAAGRLGQKTGAGFYRYAPGSYHAEPDVEVETWAIQAARERGLTRRAISDQEIQERCLLALINAGATVLDEGIVPHGDYIDVIWAYGYGFPRHRGGPMFYADSLGLPHVVARLLALAELHGTHFEPAAGLVARAAGGEAFSASTCAS